MKVNFFLIAAVLLIAGCKKGSENNTGKSLTFQLSSANIWLGINNLLLNNTSSGFTSYEWKLDGTTVSYDKIPIVSNEFYWPGKHTITLTGFDNAGNTQQIVSDTYTVYDKIEFKQIQILEVKQAFKNLTVNPSFQDSLVGFFIQSIIDSNGNYLTPLVAANCANNYPTNGWNCILGGCKRINDILPSSIYEPVSFCKVSGDTTNYIKLFRKTNVLQLLKTTLCRFTDGGGISQYSFMPDLLSIASYDASMNQFTVENDYLKIGILISNP
jgi:hypothetical protein